MREQDNPPRIPKLSDNQFAPEVFVEEAVGFFLHHGNISITFCAPRVDHSAEPASSYRVVNLRIIMPVSRAQGLAAGLYEFLQKRGLDPVPKPAPTQVQ